MNERFAIAPRCFRTWQELRYLLEKLGPYEGRYGLRFPSRWWREVESYVAHMPPVEAQRVRELVRRHYESAFVKCGRPYDPTKSWTANVLQEQASQEPFDGVVGDVTEPGGLPTLDVLEDLFPASRDWRGLGTPDNYVKLASMLIESASALTIVDPYFHAPIERNACVLRSMLRQMQGSRCCRLTIWAREREVVGLRGSEWFSNTMRRILKETPIPAGGLRYFLFNDVAAGSRQHARYLLTQSGALRFESGLSAHPDEIVDVSIVDRGVHRQLVDKYLVEDSPLISQKIRFESADIKQ